MGGKDTVKIKGERLYSLFQEQFRRLIKQFLPRCCLFQYPAQFPAMPESGGYPFKNVTDGTTP